VPSGGHPPSSTDSSAFLPLGGDGLLFPPLPGLGIYSEGGSPCLYLWKLGRLGRRLQLRLLTVLSPNFCVLTCLLSSPFGFFSLLPGHARVVLNNEEVLDGPSLSKAVCACVFSIFPRVFHALYGPFSLLPAPKPETDFFNFLLRSLLHFGP